MHHTILYHRPQRSCASYWNTFFVFIVNITQNFKNMENLKDDVSQDMHGHIVQM